MGICIKYDDLMWLSYARGGLESSVCAEMELHRAACGECAKRLDFCRKLAGIVELNSAEPPESWLDEASAKFDSVDMGKQTSNLFGALVFDSYLHGQEAVRSRSSENRRLVFDFPGFEIDLALEYSGRQINLIIGRLLAKTAEAATIVNDFSLNLLAADRTYSTRPNAFGEFSFSLDSQVTGEPLELRCAFDEGPCAVILIPC
jgi:hypothetical protein